MNCSRVPAARNALNILSFLSSINVPVSAARIRAELSLPRSTTYHLLNELVAAGFVVHLSKQQTYGLGMVAYSMANAYVRQQPMVRMATPEMERIAQAVGGSCHLARLSGAESVYLQEVRAPGALSLVTDVGVRLPATRTASGRIMLAHLPEAEVRALYSTSGGAEYAEFRALLDAAKACGFAEEVEEVSRGQASVGVVVLDHLERPAAALTTTYPVAKGCADGVLGRLQRLAASLRRGVYG